MSLELILWVALLKRSSLVLLSLVLISSRVFPQSLFSLYLSICYCLDALSEKEKLLAMSNLPRLRRQLLFLKTYITIPGKTNLSCFGHMHLSQPVRWGRLFPPSHTVVRWVHDWHPMRIMEEVILGKYNHKYSLFEDDACKWYRWDLNLDSDTETLVLYNALCCLFYI